MNDSLHVTVHFDGTGSNKDMASPRLPTLMLPDSERCTTLTFIRHPVPDCRWAC